MRADEHGDYHRAAARRATGSRPARRSSARPADARGGALGSRPDRPDRLQGRSGGPPRVERIRPLVRLGYRLGREQGAVRRGPRPLRDGGDVADRPRDRDAPRARDRALPERVGTAWLAARRRFASRAAGGDSERRPRALGDSGARPLPRRPRRAVAARRLRLPAALPRHAPVERRSHRRGSARHHGRPDRGERLPRALPQRPTRAGGRGARAGGDALGDGARRRPLLLSARDRGGRDPRARPRARRGDRRHAGDRCGLDDPFVAVRPRGHAREPDRRPVPGCGLRLQVASLFYLAAILLVIGLLTNLLAQLVVRRFAFQRTGGS